MRLTDTHCHLYFRQYQNDLDEVIQRAIDAGVERILVPGVDLETSREAIRLAEEYQNIFCAVGIHPNSANSWDENSLDQLEELAAHPRVVAVGEIGLDYYREQAPQQLQDRILREQLDLAANNKLPVILHVRNKSELDRRCIADLLDRLENWTAEDFKSEGPGSRPGVVHSFSGNVEESSRTIQAGFMIGIVGFVTFKNAEMTREVVLQSGVENLLVETDGPFIAPDPFRGRRNEPAHVRYIVDKISEVTGLTPEQAAAQTAENAGILFRWE